MLYIGFHALGFCLHVPVHAVLDLSEAVVD